MIAQARNESENIALKMDGISKAFGPIRALSDVSLTLRPGTIHALVGENGAGKSTLMKVLSGVYKPDTGSIAINNVKHDFENPQQAIKAGISMIYQDLDLAEDLTVSENVFLGNEPQMACAFMVEGKKMTKMTAELIDQFGFDIHPDAVISEMPTGDCQIAEILKALARNSSILVMDEPTSSLSEKETDRLFYIIKDLRARGISIIYISHRLEEIIDLADDITVLRDGQVVHHEEQAELDISTIVHHMVGRELKDFYPKREVETGKVSAGIKDLSTEKVKDISFDIRSGEIVGMSGLVGAGRTEIARAIFGIDNRTTGTIAINGEHITVKNPTDAINSGIAYLTEDRKRTGLCLNLPCGWNITLASLDLLGFKKFINPNREKEISVGAVNKIAIKWNGPDAPAESLSGGNQQKLLIARWLLSNSQLMIFDEPTRGIDVGAKKEIYSLLNDLAAKGKAILFISSELPELLGITDRILVMRRGKLVANLVTKETNQDEIMHLSAVEQ